MEEGERTAEGLRVKSDAELRARVTELDKEQFLTRGSVTTGDEKKQGMKRLSIRKEKARILTILRERELRQQPREPLL